MKIRMILALLLCLIPIAAHARDAKQDARIEHLISNVESLKGAVFIRNGTEYDTKAAGSHLRMKLGKAGGGASKPPRNSSTASPRNPLSQGNPTRFAKPMGRSSTPGRTSTQGSRNTTRDTLDAAFQKYRAQSRRGAKAGRLVGFGMKEAGKEDDLNDSFAPYKTLFLCVSAALRDPFPVCIENFHAAASIAA